MTRGEDTRTGIVGLRWVLHGMLVRLVLVCGTYVGGLLRATLDVSDADRFVFWVMNTAFRWLALLCLLIIFAGLVLAWNSELHRRMLRGTTIACGLLIVIELSADCVMAGAFLGIDLAKAWLMSWGRLLQAVELGVEIVFLALLVMTLGTAPGARRGQPLRLRWKLAGAWMGIYIIGLILRTWVPAVSAWSKENPCLGFGLAFPVLVVSGATLLWLLYGLVTGQPASADSR